MRESTTYQAILREGRNEGRDEGRITEARRLLLRQGSRRFGAADLATMAAVEAIAEIDRLEALFDRLLDPAITDWAGLLAC